MVKPHLWKLIIAVALAVTLVAPGVSATSTVFQSPPESPPSNDDFASATVINDLPNSATESTTGATAAPDDPVTCTNNGSVWYAFTPAVNMQIVANTFGSTYDTVLSVYTGSRGALAMVPNACNDDYNGLQSQVQFSAVAGTTYYFLIGFCCGYGGYGGGNLMFSVQQYIPPPPSASFWFSPYDPTMFDNVYFYNYSWDPANIGFQSQTWNFGDGSTSIDWSPLHHYTTDGDYTVNLSVTTYDGRTASNSQAVHVKTHDVAITKFTAPQSASMNQTRQIIVGLSSKRYTEQVRIEIYKSVPGGYELFGTQVQAVPVRTANRTTDFSFSYTFTKADVTIGKVTFRAVATIVDARDALPADNESIASPTKVAK